MNILPGVNVRNDTVKGLIEGETQFEVPIWQRQYTWGEREHEQLWQDLCEQHRHLQPDAAPGAGHFFGSIVLSPHEPSATGVSHFLVIDGQQRLTTVMLLLCAIRDLTGAGDDRAVEKYNELYLMNKYADGEDRFRLLPTEADRSSFLRRLRGEP